MNQTITVRQLQEIYLGMMEHFHDFCVEHGLTYYMVGGTLLGAVRERGFIPWDDDVDFAMPRPDYERFIREYSGELVLQSMHERKDYCFPYIKLFHRDTPIRQIRDEQYNICSKVFVKFDIYPIDGVGDNKTKALAREKKVSRRKKVLYWNLARDKSRNPIKRAILAVIRWIPSRWILRSIDRAMQTCSVENSTLWTRWREGSASANIVDRTVFAKPVLLPFERLSLFAPRDYHAYLTNVYGDYTVEKRENSGLRHDTGYNALTKRFAEDLNRQ